MANKIIAIDIDDVLVDTGLLLLDYYSKTYGTDIKTNDLYSLDLRKWGVTETNIAISRADAFFQTDEFKLVAPKQSVITSVMRLSKHFELHVVMSRESFLETATRNMLNTYFPGAFRSVIFCGIYRETERSKADARKEIGADILVDDHLNHAIEVAHAGNIILLFSDYPWNKTSDTLTINVHRIKDRPSIVEYLHA